MSVSFTRRVQIIAATCACTAAVFASAARAQTTVPTTAAMGGPGASPATAPVVPADPSTPRGALKSLVTAMQAGDSEKIKHLISTTNPTEDRMVSAMASMSASEKKFRSAAETAFGPNAKELTGDVDAGTAEGMAKIDASKENVTGEKATIEGAGPEGAAPLNLTKDGTGWRIPISELSHGIDPSTIGQRLDDLAFMSKMMNESADEVSKGMYKTPKDAGEAIKNKMMVAMMKRAAAATQPATGPAMENPAPAPMPAPSNGM